MPASTLTVTQVNQNFSLAKRAVANGPVTITERGEPSLVLMRYEDFQTMCEAVRAQKTVPARREMLWEMAARLAVTDIEFELPPRVVGPDRASDQGLGDDEP